MTRDADFEIKEGAGDLLEAVERTVRRSFPQPDGMRDGHPLSPEQKAAADAWKRAVK